MTLADIKDQLVDTVKARWSDFQESTLFIEMKEKYDDMSPSMQKIVQVLGSTLVILILVTMPWSWMETSQENLESFETRKGIIRNLLQLKRDMQQAPQVPLGVGSGQLKSETQVALQSTGLTADQIKSVEEVTVSHDTRSHIVPKTVDQSGVQVQIWKINLTQFIDLSYRLQRLNPSAKLMSIDMKANSDDPHYYDVIYQLVSFSPPQSALSAEAEEKGEKR